MCWPLAIFDRLMYNAYRSPGKYYCGGLCGVLAVIALFSMEIWLLFSMGNSFNTVAPPVKKVIILFP